MDVIGEIIEYEKHAESIVQQAKDEAKELLCKAEKIRDEEKARYDQEEAMLIEQHHRELSEKAKAHCEELEALVKEKTQKLDEIFLANSERWSEEIFASVISAAK